MIEADSLSSLNLLAANPPRYPVNPTDTPRDPLTLYISRVPGTRDVILSTLKPQRKNVTFEDVANALYYIHLDVPADALHHPAASAGSQAGASPASITRKPVPSALPPVVVPPLVPAESSEGVSTLAPSTGAPPVLAPTSPVRTSTEVTRRPVPAPVPVLQPPSIPDQQPEPQSQPPSQPQSLQPLQVPIHTQSITRKPLGPRPLNPLSDYERSLLPPLPPRPNSLSMNASSLPPSPTQRSPRSPTHPSQNPTPFQLTVIRRDPLTNHQWNVGKVIGDGQDVALSPGDSTPIPAANPNIKIVLETSGYAKFRDASDDVFHRDVAMAYGKSWTAGLRKVKDVLRDVTRPRGSSMTGEALFADRSGADRHERGEDAKDTSRNNRHSFDGRLDKDRMDKDKPEKQEDMKPKGYAFASPWDGRCEFRTGNGGRSLKLRHVLGESAHSAGGYNPLTIVQGLKDGQGLNSIPGNVAGRARAGSLSSALAGAVPVSELRFNLPSGDIFGHKRSKSSSSHSDYTEEEEEEEYSLDLGRERAGGGNRGKRAKLGKLIVYDDGFKMLDLVVAANVGVWWVSWEKVF